MTALRFPGALGIVLGIVVGMIFGGLWALPAALIKAYKGGHEVITTIMLNNVAMLLTTALVAGPWRDPAQESPSTASVGENTYLPVLLQFGDLQISSGLLVGVIVALSLWWWLRRTVSGYELQAVGANPTARRSQSSAGVG
jgi:general nucleoside transport system permease protein